MEPRVIHLIRLIVFGVLLFFSLLLLGLAAHLASIFNNSADVIPDTLGMGIAIPILTMLAIIPVVVIDFMRKGAFTGLVVVELSWTFLLWVLWLANAGLATDRLAFGCVFIKLDSEGFATRDNNACGEQQALVAFSWLSWLLVMGWFIFVLTITIISHQRGNTGVWTQPVSGTDFFAQKPIMTSAPLQQQQQQPLYGAPVQQQYTGQPMQQQYTGATMQTQYTGPQQPQQATYPPQGYSGAAQV